MGELPLETGMGFLGFIQNGALVLGLRSFEKDEVLGKD